MLHCIYELVFRQISFFCDSFIISLCVFKTNHLNHNNMIRSKSIMDKMDPYYTKFRKYLHEKLNWLQNFLLHLPMQLNEFVYSKNGNWLWSKTENSSYLLLVLSRLKLLCWIYYNMKKVLYEGMHMMDDSY